MALHRYTVRCNNPILDEMLRYEGAQVVESVEPQCPLVFVGTDVEDDYTTFRHSIESDLAEISPPPS